MGLLRMVPLILLCFFTMQVAAAEFTLTSPDIGEGQRVAEAHVYEGFGCQGGNVSPELVWQGEPAGTHSFAVIMHDPDAPRPGGWWHWLVFDIPRSVHTLEQGAGGPHRERAPAGSVQSVTSFGSTGYGGPCPPEGHGLHHYVFTVYALDAAHLSLSQVAQPADVMATIRPHVIGSASLTALYQR